MKVLGDYWVLSILNALDGHQKRFTELQKEFDVCSPVTLSSRLKKMECDGLITRHAESQGIAVSYSLTPKGKQALPVIKALDTFSASL